MLQLTFNPGLTLTGFQTTWPRTFKDTNVKFPGPQNFMCKCLKTYALQATDYFWKNHDSIFIHIFKIVQMYCTIWCQLKEGM